MIALDAMGGDFAPAVTVHGAINAAKKGVPVILYGDQDKMTYHLDLLDSTWRSLPLTLIHCSQVIGMGDEPTRAVVKQQDSSLVCAVNAVAHGKAQAVVSAGNSGAALVAGTLLLERIDGLARPALAAFLPTNKGRLLCLDLGANSDCKPEFLEQFALMGHAYLKSIHGVASPRIALLSNGAEAYKGSLVVKQAYALLEKNLQLNFIGNLESRYIFDDKTDVIVSDGFTGNIMLKAVQGTAQAMGSWIKAEGMRTYIGSLLLLLSSRIFSAVKQKTDYATRGGALLLGVKHPLIVAHGCSSALAIERALLYAHEVVNQRVIPTFNEHLATVLTPSPMVMRMPVGNEQVL